MANSKRTYSHADKQQDLFFGTLGSITSSSTSREVYNYIILLERYCGPKHLQKAFLRESPVLGNALLSLPRCREVLLKASHTDKWSQRLRGYLRNSRLGRWLFDPSESESIQDLIGTLRPMEPDMVSSYAQTVQKQKAADTLKSSHGQEVKEFLKLLHPKYSSETLHLAVPASFWEEPTTAAPLLPSGLSVNAEETPTSFVV